ncbi:MAG: DUF4340 domain-containing protein [Polyangiales bacterium]
MTARTPAILLAIVVALGSYVFFFERDRPGRSEIVARDGFLVAPLIRERVTGLTIRQGADAVSLSREGEGFDETWSFSDGNGAEADLERVEDYLRNWEFAMPTRTLEHPSPEDLVAFGFDQPRAVVRFEMGPSDIAITLGAAKPVDGGGYVRLGDRDHAVVVPDSVVELFDATADQFRIKNDGGAPTLDDLLDAETPDASSSP